MNAHRIKLATLANGIAGRKDITNEKLKGEHMNVNVNENRLVRIANAVAENPSTPPDTLRMLWDDVLAVRNAASCNPFAMSFV